MKKTKRGGKRPGAGPPLHGDEPKVTTSICISREVKRYLSQCDQSQGIVVEEAVRETREFKEWMEANDPSENNCTN